MKQLLQIIIYPDNENKVQPVRFAFELPDITPEEFDAAKHMGGIFDFPEKWYNETNAPNQCIRIWKTCHPIDKEEEDKLISTGKWGAIPTFPKQN